jgi:GTP-binding protein EngB required for normal cell division
MKFLQIASLLVLKNTVNSKHSFEKCPRTDPNICEYGKDTKKFYVMGPSGVGKSTFINVLTGHKHNEKRCFRAMHIHNQIGGVTKSVKDEGCFHLLEGYYPNSLSNVKDFAQQEKIIFTDTPGLNDAEMTDDKIIHRIKVYHNEEYKNGRGNITGFIILLKADPSTTRFDAQTKKTILEIAKSFGLDFLRRVIYVFVRAPFNSRSIAEVIEEHDSKDLIDLENYPYGMSKTCNGIEMIQSKANGKNKNDDYFFDRSDLDCYSSSNPSAVCSKKKLCDVKYDYKIHRQHWIDIIASINQDVVDAFKKGDESDVKDKNGNIFVFPNISEQIFYMDVGHFIQNDRKIKNPAYVRRYMKQNPEVVPQFTQELRKFKILTDKWHKDPFNQNMTEYSDQYVRFLTNQCNFRGYHHAVIIKHESNDVSVDCRKNNCNCSNGKPVASSKCVKNLSQQCQSCDNGYYETELITHVPKTDKYGKFEQQVVIAKTCSIKQCICPFGVAAIGTECPTHGQLKCKSCDSSHKLENDVCKEKTSAELCQESGGVFDWGRKGKYNVNLCRESASSVLTKLNTVSNREELESEMCEEAGPGNHEELGEEYWNYKNANFSDEDTKELEFCYNERKHCC